MPLESPVSFAQSHDAKEQIRQAVDIVDLVGGYLPLRRQGRIYLALCPWHSDSRPSLQVNPERQSWKCWVCDVGGDIFSFVMQHERIEFREALEMLAERAGVRLQQGPASAHTKPGDPNDKRTLYKAMAWAEEQFHECLLRSPQAEAARRYLEQRGLSAEVCERFHVGSSPDQWQWLLDRSRSTSFSPAVLEAAGLLGTSSNTGRRYDFFKGRVMFPVRDTQGRVIGFGGRLLPGAKTGAGKYINTRETRLFSKSEHVYGLDQARDAEQLKQQGNLVVVEGYTDVIMAHQHGLRNFVAVLGTALGLRHLRLLRRYADSITLVLDGDEAGQKKSSEVLKLFVAGELDLRILTLPEGLDPCDFLAQRGLEAMRPLLETAPDALEHAVETQTRNVDLLRDTHRANQSLERLLAVIAEAPRLTADTSSAKLLRERQVVARLAREFRMEEKSLRDRISELRSRPAALSDRADDQTVRITRKELNPFEVELFEILVVHPELADTAFEELSSTQLFTGLGRALGETYEAILSRGEPAEFSRVLSELEDPGLKNVFVELDDGAAIKDERAQEDAPARLRLLIDDLSDQAQQVQHQLVVTALEKQTYSEHEQLEVLEQLVAEERKRQGIPAPTDG